MADQPFPRSDHPIHVVAEGAAEVDQLLRRLTAGAEEIAGGAVLALGPTAWPFCWSTPAGTAVVTALAHFHAPPAGPPFPDADLAATWDFTRPQTGAGPALARLNLDIRRADGATTAAAFWWDVRRHHTLLAAVARYGRLLVFARKPNLADLANLTRLGTIPSLTVAFESGTSELRTFLASLEAAPR